MDSFQVVGAFDTETTNIGDILQGYSAFPILYQIGLLNDKVEKVTPDNAQQKIDVQCYRDAESVYSTFDMVRETRGSIVPVILVHNLGFDMYSLAPYLLRNNIRVLAKTTVKPITFQILGEDGKPELVFLDTLGLFSKSLSVLGEECGMPKAIGDWDYNLVRTPDTPLTEDELHYAKQDIYTLLAYMGYFLRKNPDIKPSDMGLRVVTKTGIVRSKRMTHIGKLKSPKLKYKVQQYWHLLNKEQMPLSNEELFTMHAATRGGFTFCAKNNASKVFYAEDGYKLQSFDSTSQHPAQMCSHLYPQDFKEASLEQINIAFDTVSHVRLDRVLSFWIKPFPFAFYGAFLFKNLRPKEGSIFEHEGIYPLASARMFHKAPVFDNFANTSFKDAIAEMGYKDSAQDAVYSFGKLESASEAILYLTELEAWIMSRCYDWDSVEALSGYLSTTFRKASDMSLLSVMRFYAAKDALKSFMKTYKLGEKNDIEGIAPYYPDVFTGRCAKGIAEESELKEYYMLSKADLNSLFGIEAQNEAQRDYELDAIEGLVLTGEDGVHNLPKSPKCHYQYGARIVGWSRVAQVVIMELIAPYVEHIICGDTDSLKLYYHESKEKKILSALNKHARALDKAKKAVCRRAQICFKQQYSKLDGIGHYVDDGGYSAFSAAWNKSYIGLIDGKCKLTIAGIPTNRRSYDKETGEKRLDSYNDFCNALLEDGMSFSDVASLAIGYNVTLDSSITKLNARIHPLSWSESYVGWVTDYRGVKSYVKAPLALALYPTPKTVGDIYLADNAINCEIARKNNPDVNFRPVWLKWVDGKPRIER